MLDILKKECYNFLVMNIQNRPTPAQKNEIETIVNALEAHFKPLRTKEVDYYVYLHYGEDLSHPGEMTLSFAFSSFTNGQCKLLRSLICSTHKTSADRFLHYIRETAKEMGIQA